MDRDEVLATFDRQMRREARPDGPGDRVERVGPVVRHVGAEHSWSGVLWSDLTEDDADAVIAEQVAALTAAGRPFEWKLYDYDRPADLGDRLRAAGLVPDDPETMMVAEIADLPDGAEPPDGVRLVPVTDRAGVDLMAEVHEQAFGRPPQNLGDHLLDQLTASPDTVVAVLAMAGDTPVSAARLEMYAGTGFAGLWGGGTVAAWRGKGIYRALIAYRARIAADRGYRWLQVDASDQSRPILARLGFTALAITTPYRHPDR